MFCSGNQPVKFLSNTLSSRSINQNASGLPSPVPTARTGSWMEDDVTGIFPDPAEAIDFVTGLPDSVSISV